MLRLKSVVHNRLEYFCLSSGARTSVNARRSGLKTASKLVTCLSAHYRLLVLSAILLALCVIPVSVANAKTVTLGWDSNDEPDLEGYVIYRNTNSPGPPYNYSDEVPEDDLADPLHPQAKLTGLQEGKEYYIALTAYNTDGTESSFSEDICVQVADNAIELCDESSSSPATPTSTGGGGGGGSGGGGSAGCFISAASNSPSAKNFLPYVIFTLTAIGIGTYGCRKRFLDSASS